MTQKSYPWPGKAPAQGADAGRYTAKQWWAAWASMNRAGGLVVEAAVNPLRTDTTLTNIGVFYSIPNRLVVTDAGGFVAEIDTGGALVEGEFYYNDATVSLTMPASQTYYVVLRKNYTAATYTPPGYVAGDGTVPAYTTRITWVSALVQNTARTTYWDIPLATVVTDAAEITTVTDTREYVDAETKRVWIPATRGYNITDVAYIDLSTWVGGPVAPFLILPTLKDSLAAGSLMVPNDLIGSATLTFVCLPVGAFAGGVTLTSLADYGTCGESHQLHSDTLTTTPTIVASVINCPITLSLTAVSVGDLLGVSTTYPDASTPGAYAHHLYALGWYFDYFGWR